MQVNIRHFLLSKLIKVFISIQVQIFEFLSNRNKVSNNKRYDCLFDFEDFSEIDTNWTFQLTVIYDVQWNLVKLLSWQGNGWGGEYLKLVSFFILLLTKVWYKTIITADITLVRDSQMY